VPVNFQRSGVRGGLDPAQKDLLSNENPALAS